MVSSENCSETGLNCAMSREDHQGGLGAGGDKGGVNGQHGPLDAQHADDFGEDINDSTSDSDQLETVKVGKLLFFFTGFYVAVRVHTESIFLSLF